MLCPSRERPAQVADLRKQWAKVTGQEADLLVAVDANDPQRAAYEAGGLVQVLRAGHRWLAPILNDLAAEHAPDYEYIGFLGDDHRPVTPGWAARLAGAAGLGVAYGNDLIQGPAAATAVVISSRLVTGLGFMVPGRIRHLCMDLFWLNLGQAFTLAYLPDVIIEHLHPTVGKNAWDAGYSRVNAPAQFDWDWGAYREYLAEGWPADLHRLRAQLGDTP
jgi:hypothetical protein